MWPYSWTHVGTPSHLGHMDRVAATMPSQAHAGAAQEVPNIGQREGQDVPLVRPSSCIVKGGIPSSRRYLPTYLPWDDPKSWAHLVTLPFRKPEGFARRPKDMLDAYDLIPILWHTPVQVGHVPHLPQP